MRFTLLYRITFVQRVPKCITSSLLGINKKIVERESTATTHHIVNYPTFCAIREDLYGNVFSYPAALSRVARTQNQRPSSPPLVKSSLTSRRTSTLYWYEAHSHTYPNGKPHSHTAQSNIHRPNVCTGK